MKNLVPAPLLTVSLVVLWLMLSNSVALPDLLLAVLIGIVLPLLTRNLRPQEVRISRPGTVILLVGRVFVDVIRSNIEVARHVWFYRSMPPNDQWVVIPLQLKAPAGLAALAVIAVSVPGTVWSELSMDRTRLLFHVFHVPPGQDFVKLFKERYEQPLMEIFE